MKDKKADIEFTGGNMIGIIIAILGLLILGGLFYILYKSATSDPEAEAAKTLLDTIDGKINAFLKSDAERTELTIKGIGEQWFVFSWNPTDREKPDKCFFNNCLCICKTDNPFENSHVSCQESGFCKTIEKGIETKSVVTSPNLVFKHIPLPKRLVNLEITKLNKNGDEVISIISS